MKVLCIFTFLFISFGCEDSVESHEDFHTNIFKTTAIFTPCSPRALELYKNYQRDGTIKIQKFDREIENVATFGLVDLSFNQEISCNQGFYIENNLVVHFPEGLIDISVLPNNQVRIEATDGRYITIYDIENPSSIDDLFRISIYAEHEGLDLHPEMYELDPNTNEYVLLGHASKQCIPSGYYNWISTYNKNWIEKEISYEDLYIYLSGDTQVPQDVLQANTIEDKVNHMKNALQTPNAAGITGIKVLFGYTPEEQNCQFYIRALNGFCFSSNNEVVKLDESILEISNERLPYTMIIPKAGYVLNKNNIQLDAATPVRVVGEPNRILKSTIKNTYKGNAELYTNPETGEISYLVY